MGLRSLCVFVLVFIRLIEAGKESFIVTFQKGITNIDRNVDNQWMEYTDDIPMIQDFTACHWMNTKYFSKELMPVWSYCMIKDESKTNDTVCLQISFIPESKSANRDLKTEIFMPWYRIRGQMNKAIHIPITPFRHRAWNHVCWVYDSHNQCHNIFYNGVDVGKECDDPKKIRKWTSIPGSKYLSMHSFVIGQEQDEVGTYKFDYRQTINGDITEVNIWSRLLSKEIISAIADCRSFKNGDIISWAFDKFSFNNVTGEKVQDLSTLCKEEKTIIISTQKQTFKKARDICQIHGGRLVVPKSKEENDEVIQLLSKHERSCLVQESCVSESRMNNWDCYMDEPVTWIGLKQKGTMWFELDKPQIGINIENLNYTNWDTSGTASGWGDAECAYMKGNGEWRYGTGQKCNSVVLKLCPICYVYGTPVFTFKGFDGVKWIDWNYYMVSNNLGEVEHFDGYKNAKMQKEKGMWKMYPKLPNKLNQNVVLLTNLSLYPMGRFEWHQYGIGESSERAKRVLISFSQCQYDTKFTCSSGHCIDKSKRCDHVKDCNDGSDEKNCSRVLIPLEYSSTKPPENFKSNPVSLKTRINILSIDSIDTQNMVVVLTLEIRVRWIDQRLTYNNLVEKKTNFIPAKAANKIWLPLENVIFVDSVVGEMHKDVTKEVAVRASNANGTNADNSYEDVFYNGTNNELEMTQIFKVPFKCVFDLYNFPFDEENCIFSLKMRRVEKLTTILVKDEPPTIYQGPETIHQFKIGKRTSSTNHTKENSTFSFTIELKRNYMHQMFATYFPTFLLWLLTYATLYIDVDDFDNRFQGSVTAMLVLAALLNSITNSLPRTSYLKLIDLWFFWHTIAIFSVIMFHILLAKVHKSDHYRIYEKGFAANGFVENNSREKNGADDMGSELGSEIGKKDEKGTKNPKEKGCCPSQLFTRIQFNRAAIITLPIISIVFYAYYFIFTTKHHSSRVL